MAFEFKQIVKQLDEWYNHHTDSQAALMKSKDEEITMLKLEINGLLQRVKVQHENSLALKNMIQDKQQEINTLIKDFMKT